MCKNALNRAPLSEAVPPKHPPIKCLCLVSDIEVRVWAIVQLRVCQSEVGFVCSMGGSAAPEAQFRERNNYCKIDCWQPRKKHCLRFEAEHLPTVLCTFPMAQDIILYFSLINDFLPKNKKRISLRCKAWRSSNKQSKRLTVSTKPVTFNLYIQMSFLVL